MRIGFHDSKERKKIRDLQNYYKNRDKRIKRMNELYHSKYKHIPRYRVQTLYGKITTRIPRIGVCNFCRAVARIDCAYTHFAHFDYDKTDLSKNILELCPKCHKHMDGYTKDPTTGKFVIGMVN